MKNLFSGPAILLYILFGIIVFSFLYYEYAYVSDREKRLNEKGIRTLLNIESGIEKKADDLTSFLAQRFDANSIKEIALKDRLNKHLYNELDVREAIQSDFFTVDSIDLKPSKNNTKVVLAKTDARFIEQGEKMTLVGEIEIDHFMKGITINEVFQCVTIIQGNKILYSDNPRILQSHTGSSFYSQPADSLGITIEKVVVNNKNYYQFSNRIHLGPAPIYLSGLIAADEYKRYTDEIPFRAIFFLVLLATLTFTIFPLVKIFVISKWERLNTSDYVYAGIGMVFSLFIFGTGIYAMHQWTNLEKETNHKLENWNKKIQENFRNEIEKLIHDLLEADFSLNKEFIYHEIFSYSHTQKDQRKEGFRKLQLPFEDSLVENTRLAFYNAHSKVGDRKYIQRMVDTKFAYQLNETDFFIESVFSFSRATREAVISTRKNKGGEILAMSTDLKTVMLYAPPRGYDYCMIDRDGQVIFSSRESHNTLDNIFDSFSGAEFIRQSILGNVPEKGKFNYGRSGFQGYISPVNNIVVGSDHRTPLFLLTYHDEAINEWQILATAIHAAGVMFLLICLVFIFRIFLGIFHYSRKSNKAFGLKKEFMTYVFPNFESRGDYMLLSVLGLLLTVIAVFSSAQRSILDSTGIWALGIFVYLIAQYLILNNPKRKILNLKRILPFQSNEFFMFNYCAFMITWFGLVLIAPASIFFSKSKGMVESSYFNLVQNEIKDNNRTNTQKLHDQYALYTQVSPNAKTFTDINPASNFGNFQSGNELQKTLKFSDDISPLESSPIDILKYTFDFLDPGFGLNPRPLEIKDGLKNINSSIFWFFIFSSGLILFMVLKMFNNVPNIFRYKHQNIFDKLKKIENDFSTKPIRLVLVGVPGSKRSERVKSILSKIEPEQNHHWQTIDLLSINTPEEIHQTLEELKSSTVLIIKNWMPQGIEIPDDDRFVILRDIVYHAQSANKHIFLYASRSISSLEIYLSEIVENNKNLAPQINKVREIMIRFMHQFHQITEPIDIKKFDLKPKSESENELCTEYSKKQFFAPKYNSIWNSLSLPERFMLSDLVGDDLLNLTDQVTLGMLYLKGLVVYDPDFQRMRCFDNGFALFIRHGISNKDLLLMEKNAKEKGRWRGVRLGLLLIALSLVGFVYVVNPNIIQGLIGVVSGITALSAAVGKISGNFKMPGVAGLLGKSNSPTDT